MSAGPARYARSFPLLPAELGLNGVVLSAERTSNTFSGEGYNQLTLDVRFTYAAATAVQVSVDHSEDATNWHQYQSISTSAGTGTTTPFTWEQAIAAASENWALERPINSPGFLRIRLNSTGGTTDSAIVRVKLGVI